MSAPQSKVRRGRGRPPLSPGEAKGAIFSVRLAEEERALVEAAAERQGRKASEWAREVLLAAAGASV